MKFLQAKVVSNEAVAKHAFVITLGVPEIAKKAVPGQFVMVTAQENVTDPLLKIPLAVHDVSGDSIELLCCVRGKKTTLLSERKTGDVIGVLGALGNGFDLEFDGSRAILIAGGVWCAATLFFGKTIIKTWKDG